MTTKDSDPGNIEDLLATTLRTAADQTRVDYRLDDIIERSQHEPVSTRNRSFLVVAAALLIVAGSVAALSGTRSSNDGESVTAGLPNTEQPLSSAEQSQLDELINFHKNRQELLDVNFETVDSIPDLLTGHDAVVGTVVDVLPGSAYVGPDEATLDAGDNSAPTQVDFDDPNASWRTFILVVDAEEILSGGAPVNTHSLLTNGMVRIGVVVPSIEVAQAFKHIGRAVFFVHDSALFLGDTNTVGLGHAGTLLATLDDDQLTDMPLAWPQILSTLSQGATLEDLRANALSDPPLGADIAVRFQSDDKAQEFLGWLDEQREVLEYAYISPAQALEDFKSTFEDSQDLIEAVVEADLPAMVYVTLVDSSQDSFASFSTKISEAAPNAELQDYRLDVDPDLITADRDGSLIGTQWDLVAVNGNPVGGDAPSIYFFENDAYRYSTCVELAGTAVISQEGLILDPPGFRQLARCNFELSDIGRTPRVSRLTDGELVLDGVNGTYAFSNGGPADRTLNKSSLTAFDERFAAQLNADTRKVGPGDGLIVSYDGDGSGLGEWFSFENASFSGDLEEVFRLRGVDPTSNGIPSWLEPADFVPGYDTIAPTTTTGPATQEPPSLAPGLPIGSEVLLRIPDTAPSGVYRLCQHDAGCIYLIVE